MFCVENNVTVLYRSCKHLILICFSHHVFESATPRYDGYGKQHSVLSLWRLLQPNTGCHLRLVSQQLQDYVHQD